MGVTFELPDRPDLTRLVRQRRERLRGAMAEAGIDVLILLGNSNVTYATGTVWPLSDAGRAISERPVAVVTCGDDQPHLFAPAGFETTGLDRDHRHGPVYLDHDEGVERFARALYELVDTGASVGIDELTGAMHRQRGLLFEMWPPRSASDATGPARVVKTLDELACIRHAMWITEQAARVVQDSLTAGARQIDLTARFLRMIFELGAEANVLDPIWQVMPAHRSELPWTVHGDLACPLLNTDRPLEVGDVVWVDTGISWSGYHSDFGRTWLVDQQPSKRQRAQYEQWLAMEHAVVSHLRAGVRASELTAAAREASGMDRPWMSHFYLGHGLGLDSAEAPYVGTDLGDAYDDRLVLEEGTVLVVEPLVWDEGHSGYRSENVYVVTADSAVNLTDYPYDPYGD
jgi:Xaa-Pro aminopeptidase